MCIRDRLRDLVEKQIYGYYSAADIKLVDEPHVFTEDGAVAWTELRQKKDEFKPIKTYKELPTDPLSGITSALSKMGEEEGAIVQVLIRPINSHWKHKGKEYISETKKKEATPDEASFSVDAKTLEKIDEKVSRSGFETAIRCV